MWIKNTVFLSLLASSWARMGDGEDSPGHSHRQLTGPSGKDCIDTFTFGTSQYRQFTLCNSANECLASSDRTQNDAVTTQWKAELLDGSEFYLYQLEDDDIDSHCSRIAENVVSHKSGNNGNSDNKVYFQDEIGDGIFSKLDKYYHLHARADDGSNCNNGVNIAVKKDGGWRWLRYNGGIWKWAGSRSDGDKFTLTMQKQQDRSYCESSSDCESGGCNTNDHACCLSTSTGTQGLGDECSKDKDCCFGGCKEGFGSGDGICCWRANVGLWHAGTCGYTEANDNTCCSKDCRWNSWNDKYTCVTSWDYYQNFDNC